MDSLLVDSIYNAELSQFKYKLGLLHQALRNTSPIIDQMKEVLSLQWLLGNIGLIVVFLIGLKLYFFAKRAIRSFNPSYTLPSRWLWIYITSFVLLFGLFNFLPRWIPINAEQQTTHTSIN